VCVKCEIYSQLKKKKNEKVLKKKCKKISEEIFISYSIKIIKIIIIKAN
jgi:hypothetical protein